MEEIKITEKDLIGEIEGFPIEVVRAMVKEQIRQGNNADVEVFQKCSYMDKELGGFRWEDTEVGYEFWDKVIFYKDFKVFFEKYPKQDGAKIQGTENTTTVPHKEIDWEQRRYEIAKFCMHGILTSVYGGCHQSSDHAANMAIYYADALIAELKKGGAE